MTKFSKNKRIVEEKDILIRLLAIDRSVSTTLSEKLSTALTIILEVPWLRLLSKAGIFVRKDDVFELLVSKDLGFEIEKRCQKIVEGYCLCGRAIQSKKVEFASCIDERHEVIFTGIEPHGHYNVPIMHNNSVVGVVVFYLPHGYKKNEEEMRFIESCGQVLSQIIIAHQHAEEIIRARDAALFAERAKDEFLANMSHEIRTPMNGILGMAQLLEDTKLSSEQKNMLATIRESGDSLLTILNDILDLSKIQSGKLNLELIQFDIVKCVRQAAELSKLKAKEKNVYLKINSGNFYQYWIRGDITRIRQIVVNFVTNAVKFTSEGGVCVELDIKELDQKKSEISISVNDTGIGIPKEAHQKLFLAFSQADNSTTRKYGGTGLGLSICYKLSKMMGGEVTFKSEENVGTTFIFKIILEKIYQPKANILKKSVSNQLSIFFPIAQIFPHRILIVEDNLINLNLAKLMLEKLGYVCDTAQNGKEAVDLINARYQQNKDQYTMVFMDMQMPVMDGVNATVEIFKKIPDILMCIVAMTANAFADDRQKCLDAGMVDFITKPLKIERIKEVLIKFSTVMDANVSSLIELTVDEIVSKGDELQGLYMEFSEDYTKVEQAIKNAEFEVLIKFFQHYYRVFSFLGMESIAHRIERLSVKLNNHELELGDIQKVCVIIKSAIHILMKTLYSQVNIVDLGND